MSKTRDLVDGKISPEAIFGTKEAITTERAYIHSLGSFGSHARKGSDFAIAMASRLVDPLSPYATISSDLHRPVILVHPLPASADGLADRIGDERRIERFLAFSGVAKAIVRGNDVKSGLIMPHTEKIMPVAMSNDETRMIVGQLVYTAHISKKAYKNKLPIIPGTYDEMQLLEADEPDYFPEKDTFVAVLAHADAHGSNSNLFKIASLNQFIEQEERQERQDSYDGSPVIPPMD